MKQNITNEQFLKLHLRNAIKLMKLIGCLREDIPYEIANICSTKESNSHIVDKLNIGKMMEILQKIGIKIIIDNCIPASVRDCKNNKEYCEMELCDALWNAIVDNIERN